MKTIKKSPLMYLTIAALILTSAPAAQAWSFDCLGGTAKKVGAAAFVLSLVRFFHKHPTNNPDIFDQDALFEGDWNQALILVDEKWIGQAEKHSCKACDHPGVKSKGVYGFVHKLGKSTMKALALPVAIVALNEAVKKVKNGDLCPGKIIAGFWDTFKTLLKNATTEVTTG